jgi:hypothetical protein
MIPAGVPHHFPSVDRIPRVLAIFVTIEERLERTPDESASRVAKGLFAIRTPRLTITFVLWERRQSPHPRVGRTVGTLSWLWGTFP